MRLPISDEKQLRHHLATVHPWQTDGQTDEQQPWQQLDRYWSKLG